MEGKNNAIEREIRINGELPFDGAQRHGLEVRPQWQISSSYNSMDGAEAMKELLWQQEVVLVSSWLEIRESAGGRRT